MLSGLDFSDYLCLSEIQIELMMIIFHTWLLFALDMFWASLEYDDEDAVSDEGDDPSSQFVSPPTRRRKTSETPVRRSERVGRSTNSNSNSILRDGLSDDESDFSDAGDEEVDEDEDEEENQRGNKMTDRKSSPNRVKRSTSRFGKKVLMDSDSENSDE